MEMKFYSPLTAEFFPDEPDWEDESYNEYEGYPMDGHDLLQYADAVDEAVKKDIADFNGDLMQYYHEDDSVRQKVVSAVPSVEMRQTVIKPTRPVLKQDWAAQPPAPLKICD